MGSLAQPTTPQFHSPETTTNHPNPASWMPPIPTHLSPTFPSTLYKHVQNLLNNGSWENHACFFFYAILLHFLSIKQKLWLSEALWSSQNFSSVAYPLLLSLLEPSFSFCFLKPQSVFPPRVPLISLNVCVIFIQVWCADWRCCYGHLSLSGPSGCSCGPAGSCGPSPWSYRWLSECLFGLWGACTWTAQWRAASQRPSGPLAMPRESARDL